MTLDDIMQGNNALQVKKKQEFLFEVSVGFWPKTLQSILLRIDKIESTLKNAAPKRT